jgi:hypothetical protein
VTGRATVPVEDAPAVGNVGQIDRQRVGWESGENSHIQNVATSSSAGNMAAEKSPHETYSLRSLSLFLHRFTRVGRRQSWCRAFRLPQAVHGPPSGAAQHHDNIPPAIARSFSKCSSSFRAAKFV